MNHLSEQSGTDRALTERPLSSPRCRTGSRSPANSALLRPKWRRSLSRQSDRLFLQSSGLGPSQPLTRKRVCPLALWLRGGTHSLAGEGVGEVPIRTRGPTLWYSRYTALCRGYSHEISAFSMPPRRSIWRNSRMKLRLFKKKNCG
jgi:hypothetical protein